MRKLLLFVATLCFMAFPLHGAWDNDYSKRVIITVDNGEVGATATDFPVLVSGTYSDLAHTDHGGFATDEQGDDIIFTSDAAGDTALFWEVESYNHETGALNIWVKRTLSSSIDTLIYAWVGNAAVTTFQSTITSVWDSSFISVLHLGDASDPALDSTTNNNDQSETGGVTFGAAGKIGLGVSLDGNDDYLSNGPNKTAMGATPTISLWVNANASSGVERGAISVTDSVTDGSPWLLFQRNSTSEFSWYINASYRIVHTSAGGAFAYFVLTYDGTTWRGYLNGVADGTYVGALGTYTGTTTWLGSGYADQLLGSLDEVRISTIKRAAEWIATEYSNQSAPASFYTFGSATDPTAATPTFNPVAGSYDAAQSVTVSTTTAAAVLCYTVNGDTPAATTPGTCSTGTTYSVPVSVASSLTLKAIATKAAYINSAVGSAAYTITIAAGCGDFPAALADDECLAVAKDVGRTTLAATVNSSTLTWTVGNGAAFAEKQIVLCGSEQVQICTIAGSTLTLCASSRGFNSTAAAAHSAGAAVTGIISSWYHNAMREEAQAIETALGAKLAGLGYFNVAKYGAVCDGSTDDYTAIAAAITAATTPGGIVYVPSAAAACIVGTGLVVPANVSLVGAGSGSILKAEGSADLAYVVLLNGSNTRMESLVIDGNRDNIGTANPSGTGVAVIEAVSHVKILNSEIKEVNFVGVTINADTVDIEIAGNYIHENGNTETSGTGGAGIIAGLYGGSTRPTKLNIHDNRVELNYDEEAPDATSGGIGLDATNVRIENNYLTSNCNVGGGQIANMGDAGVNRDWVIAGNTIDRGTCPSGTQWGIEIAFSVFTIANNVIASHNGGGIVVEAVGDLSDGHGVIVGNALLSNVTGVHLLDDAGGSGVVQRVVVSSNRISGATTGIIVDSTSNNITIVGNDLNDNTTTITDSSALAQTVGNMPTTVTGFSIAPTCTYATLGAQVNGSHCYCSDCDATCAAGSSNGKFCGRVNGAWAAF